MRGLTLQLATGFQRPSSTFYPLHMNNWYLVFALIFLLAVAQLPNGATYIAQLGNALQPFVLILAAEYCQRRLNRRQD
jgi:hypothetical protein